MNYKQKTIVAIAILSAVGVVSAAIMGSVIEMSAAVTAQKDMGSAAQNIHFQQGTVTSISDPLPGHHMHQLAMILPPRNDSQVYSGVLTFVATKKVEVVVLHQMTNITAIPSKYGEPLEALVPPDMKTRVAISLITPDYGMTPAMSFSIPSQAMQLLYIQ